MKKDPALAKVLMRCIASELARRLGVSRQAVHLWRKVPPQHCRAIEQLTGIPAEEQRPDLFGERAEDPYRGRHTRLRPPAQARETRADRKARARAEFVKHL